MYQMALQKVIKEIHFAVDELFVHAELHRMTGDTVKHQEELAKIARVADELGIETVITTTTLDLKGD